MCRSLLNLFSRSDSIGYSRGGICPQRTRAVASITALLSELRLFKFGVRLIDSLIGEQGGLAFFSVLTKRPGVLHMENSKNFTKV